jgi:diguanylate cyclase (GGDEF)-like protein/PAS domain S-box-containing protein
MSEGPPIDQPPGAGPSIFEALRERERLYRRLVEMSPDLVAVLSQQRIVFINAAGASMIGEVAEDLIGRSFLEFTHPEEEAAARSGIESAEAGSPEVKPFEMRLLAPDGRTVAIEVALASLRFGNEPAVQIVGREMTERLRSSESLKQSEERYRELFENANDIIFTHDLAGRITSVNKAAERITGYSREEAMALGVADLVPPEHLPVVREMMSKKVRGEVSETFYETVLLAKGGRRIPVEVSSRLILEDGVATGIQGIARDITDRKFAEGEVKQTVSLLRSTLESTYDGILVLDVAERVVSFNQRFCEMWNISPEELSAPRGTDKLRSLSQLMADSVGYVRRVQEINARPNADSFDVLEFADGRIFERYSTPQVIDGNPIGRVWSFRDVTDRKRAEEALLASERRYRMLFERNLAGVYRNTLDGRILDCNDACARILGYGSREELLRAGVLSVYYDRAARDALIERLKRERSIGNLEMRLRRKDGVPVWVLENVTLLEDEEGEPAFIEGTMIDITDRKVAEQKIEYHAYHDELTGLPNRVLFKDRLTIALGQARRFRRCVAVMFLDLDQFKFVNDTLGHSAGDQLLWGVGERLSNAVRDEDTVARLGGDEFTLLLNDLNGEHDAVTIAQKILQTIAQPFLLEGQELYLTTSIGIAVYPGDGDDAETLLKNADAAMYRAKELGRNTYQLCTPEMNRRAMERLNLQRALRRALDREEFEVHYQPIVTLENGTLVALEALIRWNHSERGLIDAAEFIDAAEEMRLLMGIGEWVLAVSAARMKEWQKISEQPIRLAVNLSTRQFQHRDIVRGLEGALRESHLDPASLAVEISETTAMMNVDLTLDVLRRIKATGARIWLDDLGTGQSSLRHLKRWPLDRIKIDHSFVREVPDDPSDAAIVSAVIAMAHALGLKVIAEGVETQPQLEFLRQQDCEEVQGHLVSRPLPPEGISELLRRITESTRAGKTGESSGASPLRAFPGADLA